MSNPTIKTPRLLNWAFFFVGMIALWLTTHNGWAMFWALVASIHVTIRIKDEVTTRE